MSRSAIRLYVKSAKVVTGTVQVQHARLRESYAVETEPKHDYVLDEGQKKVLQLVKEIAFKHGLEVEVLDVAKENVLRRALQEEREKIRTFPTLIAGPGRRLEGEITEVQVESLFSRIAEKTRKKYL